MKKISNSYKAGKKRKNLDEFDTKIKAKEYKKGNFCNKLAKELMKPNYPCSLAPP